MVPLQRFRVLGLQQIAIGGTDKNALAALWQGAFGLPKVGEFVSEKENVDEVFAMSTCVWVRVCACGLRSGKALYN